MRMVLVLPLTALMLAGCTSPRERCLRAATADLRVIDALIAETQGNIARGFAIDRGVETRTVVELCVWPTSQTLFCTRQEPVAWERPRAIDMGAERRKLADLEARRTDTVRAAAVAQGACPAA